MQTFISASGIASAGSRQEPTLVAQKARLWTIWIIEPEEPDAEQ